MYHLSHRVRPLAFVVIILLGLVLFSGGSRLFAQTDEPARADESASELTDLMKAFLADQDDAAPIPARMAATPCVAGMAGPYPCNKVDLMAFMPLSDFSAGSTNDIWGWTDPLDSKEYALLGLDNGTAFVDVTDPENPVYLGKLPTQTSSSPWRDIKVYNNYAFIVSEAGGHGMQIFDLTELRSVVSPPVTFSNTVFYSQFGDAHNVVINEDSGYAYGVGTNTCSSGLHMVNIQNPLSPVNAGCFSDDGYTHDAQCVNYIGPDADYTGDEICFNSNTDTLTIVNVENKAAPFQISRTGYAGEGYTHQGWLLDGQRYFLLGDEQDETQFGHNTWTYIWDLVDLDNPQLLGHYTGPNASIDHNMYIIGDYVFQSNYSSGLQILDISDAANGNLQQIAFFDTYPANNNASFNGSWSNYPFFDSGTIVVSGIDEGLFILFPSLEPDFGLQSSDTILPVCDNSSGSLTLDLIARNGYTGTVTLSAAGLPAGATPGFSPNPVMPPASSDLTVTLSGVSANDYPFTITGSDLPLSHTVGATLHVNDATPGLATLSSPTNGELDVDILPTLSWTAAAQGSTYYVEVATDAGFSNVVYSATVDSTSHQVTAGLASETTYFWHVQASNICGAGSFTAAFSFTTRLVPPILLVDDDDNAPDVRSYYTDALDGLELDYDIWDTDNSDDEPTVGLLSPYTTVIWFTGREFGGSAGPSSSSETTLGNWLDNGNCFFISGQDYRLDRGQTAFMADYLGVGSSSNDNGDYVSLIGQGSVFGGLGTLDLFYEPPMSDFADIISPSGSAELAFDGNNGNDAAVNKDNGNYRTTYFGFPFEAISGAANRLVVLGAFAEWCGLEIELGILERDQDEIEETVTMGETVTRTLTVSNTGTVSLTFTTSEGAAWATVSPSGGTLDPGQAVALSVVFDSSMTAGAGTYTDTLSFSGTFDNAPADVDLILHVEEGTYNSFIPVLVGSGGANAGASVPWLLPLVGMVVLAGFGRVRKVVDIIRR